MCSALVGGGACVFVSGYGVFAGVYGGLVANCLGRGL